MSLLFGQAVRGITAGSRVFEVVYIICTLTLIFSDYPTLIVTFCSSNDIAGSAIDTKLKLCM